MKKTFTLEETIKTSPLPDFYRFLFTKCDLTIDQKLEHSFELAKIVVPVYNERRPDDTRVSDCIQAIKDFKDGKIGVKELRAAAYAVRDTDDSFASFASFATAASFAASVASAVFNVASAVAYAANSAASSDVYAINAAITAATAAKDSHYTQKLIDCTLKFIERS